MRHIPYDQSARKRSVSLTLNSDLYARAREAGIDASKAAEEGLARALAEQMAESVKAEIRRDLEAYDAYVAEHGSAAELVRAHYGEGEDAV